MLALSSASACAFNPVQAAAVRIAEVSIVGFDKRALTSSVTNLSPHHAVEKVIKRAAQYVSMSADMPPKVVGDYGFDPLGLSSDESFAYYREAEIKHGRLAMLAAVAWPLQEILHPIFVDILRDGGVPVKDVLAESGGASPSLLNGGLFQEEVLPALALFAVGTAALEENDLNARKMIGCSWNEYPNSFGVFGRQPGNFGFDPLNFYKPLSSEDKIAVQERELANGRLAMLAVASYVATEFLSGDTIVQSTPVLFRPLILNPWFREFMDASFGIASMDGSINGVAY